MIKNIEDLKNIQIVCRNIQQVKDCLNYLKQLGFDIESEEKYKYNIVFWAKKIQNNSQKFITISAIQRNVPIEFYNKEFVKTLQKFIKEKEEKQEEEVKDFEVAEDGRIIKIDNWMSEKQVFLLFSRDKVDGVINRFLQSCLMKYVDLGLVYSTKEARDKAQFKMEIETKLKNIAERLNKGQKIDWEDRNQEKFYIHYNYDDKTLDDYVGYHRKNQGAIFFLDRHFLKVVKQEIGEENLIEYFTE